MTAFDATSTFMGNPCARGHEGKRYRCNGACVHCTAENAARRKQRLLLQGQQESLPAPKEPTDG
jgi:hypothetical protein